VLRALGSAAFALLTLILSIGPAARLNKRFLPLLYNRRHLGVTCFLLALLHAVLVIVWYNGFSDQNPLVSVLASNPEYDRLQGFPFESLGLFALALLFLLAATSHDFWNANLGPGLWKALHMGAYAAYAALVGHVVLGAVQNDRGWIYPAAVGASVVLIVGLHLIAGWRETRRDGATPSLAKDGWLDAGPAADIPDLCARVVSPSTGERIAVFRVGAKIFALSNRCRHQGGPLGEGRIVDGCVTCPWYGFQYRPEDGASPPPYKEKIPTHRTRIENGRVFVDPAPLPPGTEVAPSMLRAAP
jgi:nitrite reductase/ring-hydroxylating ferredoxin subunit/DMSO/TMAO reductase YedYZ heme-binding membrane subunit